MAKNLIAARRRRIMFYGLFIWVCLGALGVRVGYLIFTKGDLYEREAAKQLELRRSADERVTNPTRGYILDRNRQPLAIGTRVYDVALDVKVLDPLTAGEVSPKERTLSALSEMLGLSRNELDGYFAKDAAGNLLHPSNWQIIAREVDHETAMEVEKLRCVYVESVSKRSYNDPFLAPQTVGFMRGDGAWGLESFYNTELLGEAGYTRHTYDQENNPTTEESPAANGHKLVTTLDSGIQRVAQTAVDAAAAQTPCDFAGILVMNPYTGEILAMAQWPSFSLAAPADPAYVTNPRLLNFWDAMSEQQRLDELYPIWSNYHTTRTFEPGSIFKPMVVAAAIEENIINPAVDTFYCNGLVAVEDRLIPCWQTSGHGPQTTVEVVANSCNVAMIEIINRMGRDVFYKYRNDFGYGERTGVDLPGEASVSAPAVMYTLAQLNPVELATSAMGQGFNNTAMQALTAFSAVINGGSVLRPYLVSQIVDEGDKVVAEKTPAVVRKAISASTSNYMREAMHAVVSPGGTAYRTGHIEGYTIGGKTGSGQQGRDRERMSVSYVAYTPVDNPEFIILGVMDNLADPSLSSGDTVVPMVRKAMEEIIAYKNMLPQDGSALSPSFAASRGDDTLKDYAGMRLTEVSVLLNNLDIDYMVSGSGTVISTQQPVAGRPVPVTTPLYLYMDPESRVADEMVVVPLAEGLSMAEGEAFMRAAGLLCVTVTDKPEGGAVAQTGDPVTRYPAEVAEPSSDAEAAPPAPEEERGFIYKQFPEAGSEVPKGTQVKLKARLE